MGVEERVRERGKWRRRRSNIRRDTFLGKRALYDRELAQTRELRRRKTIEEKEGGC